MIPEADRARRCRRAGRRHPRCTSPYLAIAPGSTAFGHGRQRHRPDHRAAADRGAGAGRWPAAAPTGRLRTSLVPARRRRRELGPRPGGVDLVRGGPRRAGARTRAWPTSGYLGAIPFLLAGVLMFPSRSLRNMGRARAVLDGLITTCAPWSSRATAPSSASCTWPARASCSSGCIAVTYPVADVVTVAVVLAVLARRSERLVGAAAARRRRRRVASPSPTAPSPT